MKTLCKLFICLCLALIPYAQAAQANDLNGIYIAPKFIYSLESMGLDGGSDDPSDQGQFGGAFAVGYNFHATHDVPLRLELEYAMRSSANFNESVVYRLDNMVIGSAYQGADVTIHTLFMNVFWDIGWLAGNEGSNFIPYLGAGFGGAYVDTDYVGRVNNTDVLRGSNAYWNFAWNIGGGLAYKATDNVTVDFNVRYANFGEAKVRVRDTLNFGFNEELTADMSAVEFMLGLRYNF